MANKDWNWKYRDIQPDHPVQLTPKQKRSNWWDYHKWYVVIAGVLLIIVLDLFRSIVGGRITVPDYQFAYIGSAALPEDTVAALQRELALLGEDCNGDGQVTVRVNQYLMTDSMDHDAEYAYASGVTLMGDLETCDSYFFILENAETFQVNYQVLASANGMLPEDGSEHFCFFSWADCPVLANLELGEYNQTILGQESKGYSQELLQSLQFARRGFWNDKTCAFPVQCDTLWRILTKGATT